jgi:hypothetical protein
LTAVSNCDIVKLTEGDSMKKKSVKQTPIKPQKLGPATTHGEFLEICIKLTKTGINDPPHESDKGMIDQLDRLTTELNEWRKNETKSEKVTPRRHIANKRV